VKIAAAACALILFCSVTSVSAQTPGPQFGLKLGPTFSNVSVDPEDPDADTGMRWGIGGGGFVTLPLNPRMSLQFEALFTPKGSKTSGAAGTDFEGLEGQLALDYVEFPVLLRFDGSRTGRQSFNFFVGPAFGFNTSARNEIVVDGDLFDNGVSDNIGDEVSNFDIGLVIGAGMDFGRYFVADVRYSWGFVNVNDIDDDDTVIKNRAFTILAGIRFGRR
jgi:hypothetical protein